MYASVVQAKQRAAVSTLAGSAKFFASSFERAHLCSGRRGQRVREMIIAQAQATSRTNGEWGQAEMEFQDRAIRCIDCDEEFIWTAGEELFFHDKGLKNEPKRCKPCKQAKNDRLAAITASQTSGIKQRIEVSVNCAQCGQQTTVPFYPSQGRPVYCRACFLAARAMTATA